MEEWIHGNVSEERNTPSRNTVAMAARKSFKFQDRVKEFRRVDAGELQANDRNWRRHPKRQRDAMQAMLERVGFAGAALARETEDGKLILIDGHLRADVGKGNLIPVLVLDVTEEEADSLLMSYDSIGAMAEADVTMLRRLSEVTELPSSVLDPIDALYKIMDNNRPPRTPVLKDFGNRFELVVECTTQAEQEALYTKLVADGHKCRVLTM